MSPRRAPRMAVAFVVAATLVAACADDSGGREGATGTSGTARSDEIKDSSTRPPTTESPPDAGIVADDVEAEVLFDVRHAGQTLRVGFSRPTRVRTSSFGLGDAPDGSSFIEHRLVHENDTGAAISVGSGPTPGLFEGPMEVFALPTEHITETLAPAFGMELECVTSALGSCIIGGQSELYDSVPPGRFEVTAGPRVALPSTLPFDAITYCVALVEGGRVAAVAGCVGYGGGAGDPQAEQAVREVLPGVDLQSVWGVVGRPGAFAS